MVSALLVPCCSALSLDLPPTSDVCACVRNTLDKEGGPPAPWNPRDWRSLQTNSAAAQGDAKEARRQKSAREHKEEMCENDGDLRRKEDRRGKETWRWEYLGIVGMRREEDVDIYGRECVFISQDLGCQEWRDRVEDGKRWYSTCLAPLRSIQDMRGTKGGAQRNEF